MHHFSLDNLFSQPYYVAYETERQMNEAVANTPVVWCAKYLGNSKNPLKTKLLNDPVSGVAIFSLSTIRDGYLVRNRFV